MEMGDRIVDSGRAGMIQRREDPVMHDRRRRSWTQRVAAVSLVAFSTTLTWAAPKLEEIAPANTIAAISVSDIDLLEEHFKGTALYKIWMEPEVQAFASTFVNALKAQLKKGEREFEAEAGSKLRALFAELGDPDTAARYEKARAAGKSSLRFLLEETRSLFSGPLGIAITDLKAGGMKADVDMIAVVGWNPSRFDRVRMEKWLKLLEKAVVAETQEDVQIERKSIDGQNVTVLQNAQGKTLFYAVLDEMLLLATSEKDLRGALGGAGGGKPSLASSPTYQRMQSRFGSGGADVIGYLNVGRLLDEAVAQAPEAARAAIDASGLRAIQSGGMGIAFDGPAVRSMGYLDVPGERRGLLSLLTMQPVDSSLLNLVPREAVFCSLSRVDIPKIWEVVESIAQASGEKGYAQFQQGVAMAEAQLLMNIKDDLFGPFGDRQVVFVLPPQPGAMMGLGPVAFLIGVRDSAKISTNLDQLVNTVVALVGVQAPQFQIELTTIDHKGRQIQSLSLPSMPTVPVSPSYCVTDEYLIFGLTAEAVKMAIDRTASTGPNVSSKPDFKRTVSKLPSRYSALGYTDVKTVFEKLYALVPMVLNMAAAKGGVPVDITKLPAQNTISQHLFGSAICFGHDEHGIFFEGYSPGVTEALTAAISAVGGWQGARAGKAASARPHQEPARPKGGTAPKRKERPQRRGKRAPTQREVP